MESAQTDEVAEIPSRIRCIGPRDDMARHEEMRIADITHRAATLVVLKRQHTETSLTTPLTGLSHSGACLNSTQAQKTLSDGCIDLQIGQVGYLDIERFLRDTISSAAQELQHALISKILQNATQGLGRCRTAGLCLLNDTVQFFCYQHLTLEHLS